MRLEFNTFFYPEVKEESKHPESPHTLGLQGREVGGESDGDSLLGCWWHAPSWFSGPVLDNQRWLLCLTAGANLGCSRSEVPKEVDPRCAPPARQCTWVGWWWQRQPAMALSWSPIPCTITLTFHPWTTIYSPTWRNTFKDDKETKDAALDVLEGFSHSFLGKWQPYIGAT